MSKAKNDALYLFLWDNIKCLWPLKTICFALEWNSSINTDLGSLIGNTQCGNFRIFLPLKSYVNSILDFWSHWSSKNWRFDQMTESEFKIFGYFWNFQVWNSQKIKIHSLQNGWNDSFGPSKVCKNWFHIKSEWQKNG